MLRTDDPPPTEAVSQELSQKPAGTGEAGISWADQLDAITPLSDSEDSPPGVLKEEQGNAELNSEEDSVDLLSLGDEEGENSSLPATQADQPEGTESESSTAGTTPIASMDLHDFCKRAAKKLGVPWPDVQMETVMSRYEGKRLLKAKCSASPTPAMWDKICVVTDLCLRLHRCVVQTTDGLWHSSPRRELAG